MTSAVATVAALLVAVAGLSGCGRVTYPAPLRDENRAAAAEFADMLFEQVTVDAMMAHLGKFQEIADAHGGIRALGTQGYDASLDYVVNMLRDKGFDVETPQFEVRIPWADEPSLTVAGETVTAYPLEYTIGTESAGSEGIAGPLVPARAEGSPGCTTSDYDGLQVEGAVVLVDRGSCPFGEKQTAAAERGALALIVANNEDGDLTGATLGEATEVKIPAIGVTKAAGAQLRGQQGASVAIKLNAGVREESTRNVIAQTKTGSTTDVVMVGAHLDSVAEGPGINDNGSGVAAVLETALQLGSSPSVRNAVRFGFWGAEEVGLRGSINYVDSLDVDSLRDIALYLNFDMLASPNPGYFTLDGDQSTRPGARVPRVPEGAAGIERTLVTYLDREGKPAEDSPFDGRSDYDPFTKSGVPAGGLFAGAGQEKSAQQAEVWGGQADEPFDPHYHTDLDTLDNIDRTALQIHGGGVAYSVGLYARDQSGRNGLPAREDRTRYRLTES